MKRCLSCHIILLDDNKSDYCTSYCEKNHTGEIIQHEPIKINPVGINWVKKKDASINWFQKERVIEVAKVNLPVEQKKVKRSYACNRIRPHEEKVNKLLAITPGTFGPELSFHERIEMVRELENIHAAEAIFSDLGSEATLRSNSVP